MTDPAPLREAIARIIVDGTGAGTLGMTDAASMDAARSLSDAILAALPTDAVQPVGGVDREAIMSAIRRHVHGNVVKIEGRSMPGLGINGADKAADAILALYATAPTAGSGWLPIESAPKDGTSVDLLVNGDRWPDYAWNEKRGAWTRELGWPTRTSVLTTKPSHYFIAPAAPTVGGE